MSDEDSWSPRKSWNVGDAGNTATCTTNTNGVCYESCKKLGKCSRCNCFTCIDDVFFIKSLIAKLEDDFCIDRSQIYVTGESNGGMFTYYLASKIADLVTGYGLVCGQPMVGWLNTPLKAAESRMISFHGRDDTIMPPQGGLDGTSEWITESMNTTFWVWGI